MPKKANVYLILFSLASVYATDGNTRLGNDDLGSVSQQKKITGTVTDLQGQPMPGVTVLVKGTTAGTITDFDGNYTIGNVAEDGVLVFSFVGMKSQELAVFGQTVINVKLEEESIGLEEVVAIGYTVRKKGEVTGSISTVSSESIERSGNKDIAKSLSGKVPGLIVNDRGGYPGDGDMTLLIRGKSTLGNNTPLILIDGIVAGDFSYLAPQDIESLTVLKDGRITSYNVCYTKLLRISGVLFPKVDLPRINSVISPSPGYPPRSLTIKPGTLPDRDLAMSLFPERSIDSELIV